MQKKLFSSLLAGLCTLSLSQLEAHNHNRTVIIEQPTTVIVQNEPSNVVVVESEPPPEVEERIEGCPGPDYFWIKGCWKWEGRWVWNRGYWGHRPHSTAVWTPGYWVKHHHHWSWVEGHWD